MFGGIWSCESWWISETRAVEISARFWIDRIDFPSPSDVKAAGGKGKGSRIVSPAFKGDRRANQENAGTAEAGGQRSGHPRLKGPKAPRQVGLRSPPVAPKSCEERVLAENRRRTQAGGGPISNDRITPADPRNRVRVKARLEQQCERRVLAKAHGRPVGKPPRHPVG